MATNNFSSNRNAIMSKISELLAQDSDVLITNSNELCVPIVGDDGDEGYLVITFKIPKGSRDGEVYDGYAMAEDYRMKCDEKRVKAEEKAKKKAEKMATDAKMRAEKARLKAEREAKEGK